MQIPPTMATVLRCPICTATLSSTAVCIGTESHTVEVEDGALVFARPDAGKYQSGYASRYAALWAYGYATLHSGLDEGLYRTISSFVAETLVSCAADAPLIVDAGCGVGRVTGDCARLAPRAHVLALDASPPMLAFAQRVVHGTAPVAVDLSDYGFTQLTIPAYDLDTPVFGRADVERLPLADNSADIILSVNVIDRLPRGPELAFRECYRVLKPGGTLIFADPLNWTERWLWERYAEFDAVLNLLRELGFRVDVWFDELIYREILDGRRSFEEFRTLAGKAVKE